MTICRSEVHSQRSVIPNVRVHSCELLWDVSGPHRVQGECQRLHYVETKALRKIIAEINIRRVHLKKLLRSYEKPPNGFIPEIDRDEYIGASRKPFSVEDAARHIREFWMLPDGPIANVVELIEDVGGIIVPCDFGTDLIDAISQRIDGLPVLFFVNINSPSDRLRHTLCHELGHMILHTTSMLDDEVMEHEADVFAGAFLLPAKEFRHQLRVFNLRQIANMKKYWKVSMQSIAMRADLLGLITPYQKKMFFIQISKLGYRKREPHEPPREYPKLINKMINYHLNVLSYSKEELASLLNIDVLEFEAMYSQEMFGPPSEGPNGGRHQHLHVVK